MRVTKLLMQDIVLIIIAHPRSDPWTVAGWEMTGPTPLALTIHQTKKVMPATGMMTALTVNRCRLGKEYDQILRN